LDSRSVGIPDISNDLLAGDVQRAAEITHSAIERYERALENEGELGPSERIELRLKLADCYHVQSR
jgi:O-acetyl-ADP-ribose deacetylase (regulator of RNase III)